LYLNDLGIICALGAGKSQVLNTWLAGRYDQPSPIPWLDSKVPALSVQTELPAIPPSLNHYTCRNNRLLLAALSQIELAVNRAIQQHGPERIGLVIGTSTSGIAEGEQAVTELYKNGQMPVDYHYKQQELGGAAEFLSLYLGIRGPAYTVSTTCSSSANALISARRLLKLDLCDAVIVGGSDALCCTTLEGFAALGALSKTACNPFSKNRDGTLIGEGAALFLMSNQPSPIALLGAGTSADAYHISAPRPDGSCAYLAMQAALDDADLTAEQVDYVNLHGTATWQNDAMESLAVGKLFGNNIACSSSKPATGHCLGAAGAIEAGLCWLLLSELNSQNRLPPHRWDGVVDPEIYPLKFVINPFEPNGPNPDGTDTSTTSERTLSKGQINRLESHGVKSLQYCFSNSFAFGGNNVCLLLGHPG
jgi:3-oxoacyl-[acyl-carrier-protein] synthase I